MNDNTSNNITLPSVQVANYYAAPANVQPEVIEGCSGLVARFFFGFFSELKRLIKNQKKKTEPKFTLENIPVEYMTRAIELIDTTSGVGTIHASLCLSLLQVYFKLMMAEASSAKKKHLRKLSSETEIIKVGPRQSPSFLSLDQLNDIDEQISSLDNPEPVLEYIRANLMAYACIDTTYADKIKKIATDNMEIDTVRKETEP